MERSQIAVGDDALAVDGMDGREYWVRHGVLRT